LNAPASVQVPIVNRPFRAHFHRSSFWTGSEEAVRMLDSERKIPSSSWYTLSRSRMTGF